MSAFVAKDAEQSMPLGLQTKTRAHDVIQSRQKRRFIAKQSSGAPGTILEWDLASNSEWLDLETARITFQLTLPKDNNNQCPIPAGGSMVSLFSEPQVVIKGQSCVDGQVHSDVYNAMRLRLEEEGQAAIYTYDQVDMGAWAAAAAGGNYVYDDGRKTGGAGTASDYVMRFAIPLKYVIEMFGCERSYWPAYALPANIRLRCNDVARAFACKTAGKTLPASYSLSDIAIEVDGLMMSDAVDSAFRELVVGGQVNFYYPHTFCHVQGIPASATEVTLKTNQVATCMNRALLHIHDSAVGTGNSLAPFATNVFADDPWRFAMGGFAWQAYIDSRNVFAEPINNHASLMGEIKKAVVNPQNKQRTGGPILTAAALLEKSGGVTTGVSLRDVQLAPLAVNFRRELVKDSVSGANLALTGGNCLFQLTNMYGPAVAREADLFLSSTRMIALSRSFLSVVR